MNILFGINKSKLNAIGQTSITMRITLGAKRAEINTHIFIEPKQ